MKKNILVTGGAGYIGSHTLVELIEAGYHVIVVDNLSATDGSLIKGVETITHKKIEHYNIDVCDEKAFREVIKTNEPISAVIHFAAYKSVNESVDQPLKYYSNNLQGMVNVLKMMSEFSIPQLVFSSSCSVYGQPDQLPVTEESPLKQPQSPYANSKKICEEIISDFCHVNPDVNIISLRYFNPIGAHSSAMIGELPNGVPNNLVPYLTQTAAGIRNVLRVFGTDYNTPDGSCIRDFIHVSDLAYAHVKALEYLPESSPEIFNIGTGHGVSVLQLIDSFQDATGIKLPVEKTDRRPGDVEKVWADASKAHKLLNWEPKMSLNEALLSAWNWEKKIRNL
jgi:UDP-glucose 4-epimerase